MELYGPLVQLIGLMCVSVVIGFGVLAFAVWVAGRFEL